jgi:hypothetical protein
MLFIAPVTLKDLLGMESVKGRNQGIESVGFLMEFKDQNSAFFLFHTLSPLLIGGGNASTSICLAIRGVHHSGHQGGIVDGGGTSCRHFVRRHAATCGVVFMLTHKILPKAFLAAAPKELRA